MVFNEIDVKRKKYYYIFVPLQFPWSGICREDRKFKNRKNLTINLIRFWNNKLEYYRLFWNKRHAFWYRNGVEKSGGGVKTTTWTVIQKLWNTHIDWTGVGGGVVVKGFVDFGSRAYGVTTLSMLAHPYLRAAGRISIHRNDSSPRLRRKAF